MRLRNADLSFVVLTVAILTVSGCATTPQRNYGGDIDLLNSKVSSLQNEISSKDAEIARLQSQVSGHESALKQAEDEKRVLNEKLETEMVASKKETQAPTKATPSDLK